MAKKFKVMASNAKEPDGKCIPKSMRKSVESACGKKKAVKASDSECKYRIDIFKKDNPDALVKREFKMFKSEDEAKKYGESIANGDIVNVMEVQASCTKKSVKASSENRKWVSVELSRDEYEKLRKFIKINGYEYSPSGVGNMVHVELYLNPTEIKKVDAFLDNMTDFDDDSIDLRIKGDPAAIADVKDAALGTGATVTDKGKGTIIVHTWIDHVVGLREYAKDLGLTCESDTTIETGCTKKSVKSGKVLFPWAMVGRFADGYTCEVSGDSEADCIEKLGNMQDKHGELEYYSGVDDDDYDADGRRIYSSRTKKFGVKASKSAKKRVAAAKAAKQEYISKEFVNLANDPYLQTAYDSNNLTVSLINGDTISIIAEGPNRAEIERKAKAAAKKIYPQYELYGDTKRYKDVPRDDIKSACKTKKTVKASAAAKKRKAQQRIMAAESNGLERAKQYIVDAYNNENWDSEDMTVDEYFKNEDLHKVGLVYTTLGDNDEYDYQISVDLIDPKVIVEIDGYVVYEDKYFSIDGLADDLADFDWDNWYSYYIHKLSAEYGDIFSSIKKSVNVKITASDSYYDEDIVFYFNGKKQFEGSIFDLAGNVEILCHDPKVMQVFQDYCNQFGDPIDFDGTPRDTALVFTKLVMFEAEEANEPSDFYIEYSDYRKPGSFEIYYANEGIYSAKSIHAYIDEYPNWVYDWSESKTEKNKQLYDSKLNEWYDKAESMYPNFYQLKGDDRKNAISDVNKAVGFTMDDVFTSIDIQCSDADGIADEWEDIREIANQDSYEYDGYDDGDIVEYVDQYFNRFNDVWLYADYVDYNGPDDWSVSASLGSDSVGSDFNYFLEEHYPELYNTLNETRYTEPDDPTDSVAYDLLDVITPNDFFIEFYPNNNQWSAPQIDIDTNDKQLKAQLEEARSAYEANRIDSYKAIQDGLGEFLANGITASTDIKAGITVGEDSRFDFSNPIYELDDYVKAIADGVINRIQGITYDISKETIAFFDEDNNVVFVQPIGGIIPEPDDLETDIYELSSAIKSEMDSAYCRENWEQDEDDPDYASRAVELSTDVKAAGETVDIDDLEYVTGDEDDEPAEDWGFGFNSNGDPIDESTVEELERIAQEVLDKSEIHNIDEYADLHNFNYYASIPYIQESFDISFTYVADIYELSKNGMATDEGYYTTVAPYNIHFNVRCKNGEVEYAECTDVDVNDGYVKDVELKNFNLDALVQFATDLVNPVAADIYNATTNI